MPKFKCEQRPIGRKHYGFNESRFLLIIFHDLGIN